MATIYNLDTANLFAGDEDPDHSQFLVLNTVRFPALEETTKEVKPGGGVVGVKIGMRSVAAPMISFNLTGINPKVMNKFMTNRREHYTIRGNIANISYRKVTGGGQVLLGEKDIYEPRCRHCAKLEDNQ